MADNSMHRKLGASPVNLKSRNGARAAGPRPPAWRLQAQNRGEHLQRIDRKRSQDHQQFENVDSALPALTRRDEGQQLIEPLR
jgi:hypothetical protein